MDTDAIATIVQEWVALRKGEDASLGERFLESDLFDSFDVMELVLFCEQRFAVTLRPEDFKSADFGTVAGLARMIVAKRAHQAGSR